MSELTKLSSTCHHTHLQGEWNPTKDPGTGKYVYPTAVEAEYTAELAFAIAAVLTAMVSKQHPRFQLPCPEVLSLIETGDKTYDVQWHPLLVRDRAMPLIGLRLGLHPPSSER
eukprot:1327517-Amphidinium_carterae.1